MTKSEKITLGVIIILSMLVGLVVAEIVINVK